jgi:glycosyltransferase involved in cell wall biosynthesis
LLAILKKPYAIWSDTPNNFIKRNPLKRVIRKTFLKILFWRAKAFLVTGDSGVVEAKKMNIYKGNFINFPFATNINFFKPNIEKEVNTAKIKFLSVGRIDFNHKGQDVALQSFFDIKSKGVENFSWTIAGTGPDQDNLLNRIEECSLEKEVRYLGWVEKDDVYALYNNCDVLIHSSYFDPFPNAVLEAMACGMVVVGSDLAGSVLDRIIDGYNGHVHTAGSIEDLTKKLLRVIEDPGSLTRMSLNARKTAEKWNVDYNLSVLKSLVVEKN